MNAVIMAGGSGTRLWPMSRKNFPKQLQQLTSDKSLLQETFERLNSFLPSENIYVSTAENYLAETRRHLPQLLKENFIVEPSARNTAPAIGLIASYFTKKDPHAIVVTIPSDHLITKLDEFCEAMNVSEQAVTKYPDNVVAVGINPTSPNTGLGYIQIDTIKDTINKQKVFIAKRFIEKPDLATAKKYITSWEYLWNAAYFTWRADTMLDLFKKLAPNYIVPLEKIQEALGTPKEKEVISQEYMKLPSEAIDTLIMEKTPKMLVIPADLGWSDIGSWASLHDILSSVTGNHIIAKGHHVGIDDQNCLVYAHDKLVATVGLSDIIVVDTPDALLICDKNHAQDIKKMIEKLKVEGKDAYL